MPDFFLRPGSLEPEIRFTPPTEICPHPEWWHSTDADSTEQEVSALLQGFVRGLQPELVVETGAAWGQTAQMLGKALQINGHGHCHSIEPDPERAEHTRQRCVGLPVTVEEMKSLDWEPPGPINFAFFDSLIELRVAEFRQYLPAMAKGAFVAFHDTADHHGLWPEIEALETEGLLLPIRLPTPRGVAVAEVVS